MTSKESLETQVARQAHQLSSFRNSAKTQGKRLDQLERAIARHASGVCGCPTKEVCLHALSRLIPVSRLKEVERQQ